MFLCFHCNFSAELFMSLTINFLMRADGEDTCSEDRRVCDLRLAALCSKVPFNAVKPNLLPIMYFF